MKKFIVTAALSAFCACAYAQTDSIGIYKVDHAGISRVCPHGFARPATNKTKGTDFFSNYPCKIRFFIIILYLI